MRNLINIIEEDGYNSETENKRLSKPIKFEVTPVEGYHDLDRSTKTFNTNEEANSFLKSLADKSPDKKGCDKHDFKVYFDDGEGEYSGTMCVPNQDRILSGEDVDIMKQICSFVKQAASGKFSFNPKAKPQAEEFLSTYDVGQNG